MPIVIGATIQTDPRPLRRSLDRDAKMAERTLGGAFRNIGRIGTSAITGIGRAMRRLISLPAVIGAGLAGFGLDRLIRQGAELEFQIGALAAQLSKSREEVSRYVSEIDQGTAGMLGFGGAIKAANRALQQGVPADAVAELTRQVTLLRTAAGSADGIENDLDMLFRAVGKGTNEGLGRLGLRLDTSSLQGLSTEERRARVLQQVLEGLREQTQALNVTGREAYFTYTGIYGNIKDITVELGRAVTRTEEFRNIALVLNRLTGSIAERLRKGDIVKAMHEIFKEVRNIAWALSVDTGEAIAVGLGWGLREGLGKMGFDLKDLFGTDMADRMNDFIDNTTLYTRTPRAFGQAINRLDPPKETEEEDDERWDPLGVRFRRELERLRQRNPLPEIDPDMSRDDQRDMLRQRREIEQQQRRHAMDMARQRRLPPTAEQDADTESQTALNRATDRGPTGPGLGSVIGEQFGDAINERVGQAGVAMAVSFAVELNKQRFLIGTNLGEAFAKMVGDWKDHGSEFGQSVWDFLVSDESAWTFLGTLILDGITDLDRWHDMGKAIWSAVESSPLGKWLIGQDQAGKPLSEKENAQARQNVTERPGGAFGTFMDEYARRLPFGGGLIGNWIDSNRPSFDRIPGTGDQEPPRLAPGGVPFTGREGGRPSFDHLSEAEKRRMQFGQGEARSLKEASSLFQQALQEQVIEIDVMQGLKDGGRFLLDAFIERSRQRTPQLRMRDEAREQQQNDAPTEEAQSAADSTKRLGEAFRDITAENNRMIEQMLGGMA